MEGRNMRKIAILSSAIAATLALAACTPAEKKEEAAEPAAAEEAAPAAPEAAAPAADAPKDEAAAAAGDVAKADDKAGASMKGDEHTGGEKIKPAN
jgi:hypothetical protein